MADLKISQLTGATTPLAGTEVVPLVQSSTTKKVSVTDLTAGRDVAGKSFAASSAATDFTNVDVTNTSTGGVSYRLASGGQFGYFDIPTGAFAIRDLTNGATRAYWTTAGNQVLPNGNLTLGTAAKGVNFTANTPAAGMTSQLLNWYEEGTWTPNQGSGLTVVGTFGSSGTYTRVGRMITVRGQVTGTTSVAVAASSLICTNLPYAAASGQSSAGGAVDDAVSASSTVLAANATLYSVQAIAATPGIAFSVTYQV